MLYPFVSMVKLACVAFVFLAFFPVTALGLDAARLLHPLPTKRSDWACSGAQRWTFFLQHPDPGRFGEFLVFLWDLVCEYDVATLYLILVRSWMSLAPVHAKGASRCTLGARILAVAQIALSAARLQSTFYARKWPRWFQHTWKSLPSSHVEGILSQSFSWFCSLASLVNGVGSASSSVVYVLFGHAGTYIGKANVWRSSHGKRRPGVADRLVEHLHALCFPKSRDGSLPRYRILRQSFASVCFLPLVGYSSETRCLAAERSLIRALNPICNGADWTSIKAARRQGALLQPGKAVRTRPPPPLRGIKHPK